MASAGMYGFRNGEGDSGVTSSTGRFNTRSKRSDACLPMTDNGINNDVLAPIHSALHVWAASSAGAHERERDVLGQWVTHACRPPIGRLFLSDAPTSPAP